MALILSAPVRSCGLFCSGDRLPYGCSAAAQHLSSLLFACAQGLILQGSCCVGMKGSPRACLAQAGPVLTLSREDRIDAVGLLLRRRYGCCGAADAYMGWSGSLLFPLSFTWWCGEDCCAAATGSPAAPLLFPAGSPSARFTEEKG